jgi:hypothetical protein
MNDLFETPDLIPKDVHDILATFEDNTYEECERILNKLEKIGYSFEYDLSAEPFNLRKLWK